MSEYWIIQNPAALVIYNNYQQRLTDNDRNLLQDFSAWRIIENDYILGDQFTKTIKTEHNRNIYFIQLSPEGDIVNNSQAGQIHKFRNVQVQGDTVRIKNSDRLSLQTGDKKISLAEGMLIQRIFHHRDRTYAKEIAGINSGWIKGNGPAHWEAYIPENTDQVLEDQIFSRIDQIFKSYNNRLNLLFTYLNNLYNDSKTSPQWQSEKSPLFLKYMIVPQEYINQFSNSQSFLSQELSDLLYGSSYHLITTDGQIIISKSSR